MNPSMLSDANLQALPEDDHALGDATSWGLGIGEAPGRIEFRAKDAQIACCTEDAAILVSSVPQAAVPRDVAVKLEGL